MTCHILRSLSRNLCLGEGSSLSGLGSMEILPLESHGHCKITSGPLQLSEEMRKPVLAPPSVLRPDLVSLWGH